MKEFFKSLPYAMKKHLLIRSGLSLLFLILFTIVIELVNMAQEKGIELVMNEQNTLELPPKGSHRNIS